MSRPRKDGLPKRIGLSLHYTGTHEPLGDGLCRHQSRGFKPRVVLCFPTDEARFWSKVNRNGPVPEYRPDLGPCWLWTAGKTRRGYGQWKPAGVNLMAHRASWLYVRGPLADDLVLDHLCRVTSCVNPAHLEPVTNLENVIRSRAAMRWDAARRKENAA